MKVEDPKALLEAIERKTEQNTALYDAISRIAPATRTVDSAQRLARVSNKMASNKAHAEHRINLAASYRVIGGSRQNGRRQ